MIHSRFKFLSPSMSPVPVATKVISKTLETAKSYPEAMAMLREGKVEKALMYEKPVYDEVFQKLQLKSQYSDASNRLNIIEYHGNYSPFSYYLNEELKPKNYLMFTQNKMAYKWWDTLKGKDSSLDRITLNREQESLPVRHSFLRNSLKEGVIDPDFDKGPGKVNQSLLLTSNCVDFCGPTTQRLFLFFNQEKTSLFRYNKVKYLAWLPASELMRYCAPLGNGKRRTNTLMATLFSDVKVHAYSNFANKTFAKNWDELFPDAIQLPRAPDRKDSCLMEFQSNYEKYTIDHPKELQLVIHKLYTGQGKKVKELLPLLGGGAEEFLEKEIDPAILEKTPTNVTEEEFIEISDAFYNWPFKEDINLETFLTAPMFKEED